MSKRRLSAREVEAYDRDGFLLLRRVVPDKGLLRDLFPLLRQHQHIRKLTYKRTWLYNGAVRAVIRSGLMAELIAGVVKGPCLLDEAPIWGSDGGRDGGPGGQGAWSQQVAAWHADLVAEKVGKFEYVTGWLAITDAPHGLELIRGTTGDEARVDVFRECNSSLYAGPRGARLLNHSCLMRYAKERLDPKLGRKAHTILDFRAGDMLIFHGNMLHRGLEWPRARLALSMRLIRRRHGDGFDDAFALRRRCSEDHAVVIPPGMPEFASEVTSEDPLACIREALLPRPDDMHLAPDRLPAEKDLGAGARLLRRVVAIVEGALLPA